MDDVAMTYAVSTVDELKIVEISGVVNSLTAGRVYDVLVAAAGDGETKLIVDMSGVHLITRAGIRGLVVAARLMKPGRGAMRVCGGNRAVAALIRGLGLPHLLKCDPAIEMSVLALSYRAAPAMQAASLPLAA
jgi:anti-anti-sigma factor